MVSEMGYSSETLASPTDDLILTDDSSHRNQNSREINFRIVQQRRVVAIMQAGQFDR